MAQRMKSDWLLFGTVVAMVGFGLVMIYSASAVTARQTMGDPLFYLKRQAIAAAIDPANIPPGTLRAVSERDHAGRLITNGVLQGG